MKLVAISVLLIAILSAGCTYPSAQPGTPAPADDLVGGGAPAAGNDPDADDASGLIEPPDDQLEPPNDQAPGDGFTAGTVSVPISSGTAALSPDNTKITFVGTHHGEPKPRTGGFTRFSGTIEVDEDTAALKSVRVEIETDSLWTQIPKLTDHLKSADFFETRQFPTATFQSAGVRPEGDGQFTVAGELTLHGVTQLIQFPAKVSIQDGQVTLTADFEIDRTDFGMNFQPDRIVNEIALHVAVGEKTQPETAGGGPARAEGR